MSKKKDEKIKQESDKAENPSNEVTATDAAPHGWLKEDFLAVCRITEADVQKSNCDWNELACIYEDFHSKSDALEVAGNTVAQLLRKSPSVHSVRMRVKAPDGLIRKILRKKSDDPERKITLHNYHEEISDLIGLRVLHLLKPEWLGIHKFILMNWIPIEPVVANTRDGDNQVWIESYEENGCVIEKHDRAYRSIHYVIESSPTKERWRIEIQTRTLLEEAWAELDHRINYPIRSSNDGIEECLKILNRMTGGADELASFINALEVTLTNRKRKEKALQVKHYEQTQQIEELLQKLSGKESEKDELRKIINELRGTTTDGIYSWSDAPRHCKEYKNPSDILYAESKSILDSAKLHSLKTCDSCGTFLNDSDSFGGDCAACYITKQAGFLDWFGGYKNCTNCGISFHEKGGSNLHCPSCRAILDH